MLNEKLSAHFSTLIQDGQKPLAVAFSGGGDSTALLSLLLKWVAQHGSNKLTALIVDHGLRANSVQEAQLAATRAKNMGAKTQILTWEGAKPNTGIQEKARMARYALLGEACRSLGVEQLFLGHNQDDQAETIFMRIQKQSGWRGMAGMTARKISPLWPALYGVEIIRPLLGVSRQELRDYNLLNILDYIDDPSNTDRKYTRIRARETLDDMQDIKQELLRVGTMSQECLQEEQARISAFLTNHVQIMAWGGANIELATAEVKPEFLAEVLKYLILSVSGGNHMPSFQQREGLAQKIMTKSFAGATLGGVQFIGKDGGVLLVRDPGMMLGRHNKPAKLPMELIPNRAMIWDGRFKLETTIAGITVVPLMTCFDQLSKLQKATMKTVPAQARAGLPCLLKGEKIYATSMEGSGEDYEMQCIAQERMATMVRKG